MSQSNSIAPQVRFTFGRFCVVCVADGGPDDPGWSVIDPDKDGNHYWRCPACTDANKWPGGTNDD